MTDREKIIRLAEGVMGWGVRDKFSSGPGMLALYPEDRACVHYWLKCTGGDGRTWNPLESIADAMEVSEKCRRLDMIAVDDGWMVGDGSGGFTSEFGIVDMELETFAIAPTLPRAICEAALAMLDKEAKQ